jgi:hypothetical protein
MPQYAGYPVPNFNVPPPPPPPGMPIALNSFVPPPPGPPPSGFPVMHNTYVPPMAYGMPSANPMPPPPPGFFSRRQQAGPHQDPLSSVPHQNVQAPPRPSSLPPRPSAATTISAAATVSAAPELRDFKKEATSFVPAALKRKKPGAASSSRVNAAPSFTDSSAGDRPVESVKPDLVGTLKEQFGAAPTRPEAPAKTEKGKGSKDDYAKFKEDLGDIL